MSQYVDKRKCLKQTVVALLVAVDGSYFVGSNWCASPQDTCPRENSKSGEDYELCRSVCNQSAHAEVNACKKAGAKAKGSTLYLIGHTYCCDSCKKVMKKYGVKTINILEKENCG